jgi:hypothetical protein
MCKWNNCQKELQDSATSKFTEEEDKSCHNKNFSKQLDCEDKLAKKKGLLDKAAALAYCTANKCPQIGIFRKKATREFIKRISKSKKTPMIAQREECMQKHCSKEVKDRDNKQIKLFERGYDCEKKFATNKEQEKCIGKTGKQASKAGLKAIACRIKHCDIPASNSNKKNTIKSSKKNNNKKNKKN